MASPMDDFKTFGNAAKAFCKLKILEGLTHLVRHIREIAGDYDTPDVFAKERPGAPRPKPRTTASPKNNAAKSAPVRKSQKREPMAASDVYESWSKTKLYEKAKALNIPGRSKMNKTALIAAIRRHEQ